MLRRWSIGLIVAALAALAVAPAALAGPKGTDRPFKATMSGYAYWEFPGIHPSGCLEVTTVTESPGNATHMGEIMSYWSHCPAEVDNHADGFIKLVAANGDSLWGTYDYDEATEVANPDGSFTFGSPMVFTGGTGRFASATGIVTVTYGVVPEFWCVPADWNDPDEVFACLDFTVEWQWWGTLEGRINM